LGATVPDRYYLEKAQEMQALADKANDRTREEFLRLAKEYEALAERALRPDPSRTRH